MPRTFFNRISFAPHICDAAVLWDGDTFFDAVLWDGDAMRDEKKRALAEALEKLAQEKRARLEKLGPHQRQLRVTEFFTRKS